MQRVSPAEHLDYFFSKDSQEWTAARGQDHHMGPGKLSGLCLYLYSHERNRDEDNGNFQLRNSTLIISP